MRRRPPCCASGSAWPMTPSAVTRALHRAARQAQPTYRALGAAIRGSPVVAPDETGWTVRWPLAVVVGLREPETTVYAIQPRRGFAGRGRPRRRLRRRRPRWVGTYRQFTRRASDVSRAPAPPRARPGSRPSSRGVCRAHPGDVAAGAAPPRPAHRRDHLQPRRRGRTRPLDQSGPAALDHVGTLPAMHRFAAPACRTAGPLWQATPPSMRPTRAEQAIRPAVVNRKVCGGNRSARDAQTQQVLTSVVRTAQQRRLDASQVLVDLLRNPRLFTVSRALATQR